MSEKMIQKVTEIIESYNLNEVFIKKCIEEEWVVPCEAEKKCLDGEDISRILLIKDLKEDFGVNDEAVPIILHLVDQIHWFQSQVKHWKCKMQSAK